MGGITAEIQKTVDKERLYQLKYDYVTFSLMLHNFPRKFKN